MIFVVMNESLHVHACMCVYGCTPYLYLYLYIHESEEANMYVHIYIYTYIEMHKEFQPDGPEGGIL